ncbi:hypothetical protein QC762_0011770 [Podospora pseudocomata]|uniref:Uncharacterized protein n=1 Tax=Podospora pseudocomata TaxID=2093779 RepID=A0ABR0GVF5_9PEZI|nr:hypothetical protein QC762_0011770 [Podospora pseudocomata]
MERGLLNARGFIRIWLFRGQHNSLGNQRLAPTLSIVLPAEICHVDLGNGAECICQLSSFLLCKPKKLFGTATQIFRKRTIFIHLDGRQEELASTVNLSQLDMYLTQKGQRGASLSSVVSDVIIRCPGDSGGALRIADLEHADGLHEKLSGVDI